MANLETVDVRKSIFWRKSGSNFSGFCGSLLLNEPWLLFENSDQFKGQQKPEKFDIFFRQNRLFRTSTVSKLAISEGLPSGVLNLCQKVLEICHFSSKSCKSNEFALINMWFIWLLKVSQGNLSQKSSKNEFFGSKKC